MEKFKVWFNPENNWYEMFLNDGTPIPGSAITMINENVLGMSAEIIVKCEFIVKIVNEKPVKL